MATRVGGNLVDVIDADLGGSNADTIWGAGGDDTLFGGGAVDTLYGGENADLLYGGAANDKLFGDNGNDIAFGGAGIDSVTGGNGADILWGDAGDDLLNGGADDDTIYGGDNNDSIDAGIGNDAVWGGDGNDNVVQGAGNDRLYGDGGDDALQGGAGDDALFGGAGRDIVGGGDGADTIDAGDGDDRVSGGDGNDIIIGGDGNDILTGDGGSDTIYGTGGSDVIDGGAGADVVAYTSPAFVVRVQGTTLTVSESGSGALDTIINFDSATDSLSGVDRAPTITSGGGGDTASASVSENNALVGTMAATDPESDPVTWGLAGGLDSAQFTINSSSGVLSFKVAPDFEQPADTNHDNVYQVVVRASDPAGAHGDQTISVTVGNVAENPPVITSNGGGTLASVSFAENATGVVADVNATDTDSDPITYSIAGGADASLFHIDSDDGELRFNTAPDFEATGTHPYVVVVRADDGTGLHDDQTLTVNVTNVNEAPVFTLVQSGSVTESGAIAASATTSGSVAASDPDAGDSVTFTGPTTGTYGDFDIGTAGQWTYSLDNANATVKGLDGGESLIERFTITGTDLGGLSATAVVTITVQGANDAPDIGTAGLTGDVTEDAATATIVAGQPTASDAEGDAFSFSGPTTGAHGDFTIDASGAWSYTLHDTDTVVQALGSTESLMELFTITASDGAASDTAVVTVTIHGTDDGLAIGTVGLTGDVYEDSVGGSTIAGGTLTASDAPGETTTFSGPTGAAHGSFSIGTDGSWHYTLDHNNVVVQALGNGDTLVDTVIVTVSDGSTTDTAAISVTIHGEGPPLVDLASLSPSQGFVIWGEAVASRLSAVSAAGDVDGDGYDDIVVGAYQADPLSRTNAGEAVIVFGGPDGFGTPISGRNVIQVGSLTSAQGFILQGERAGDLAGLNVSSAGDINGDGYSDVVVGATRFDVSGTDDTGRAYVVFGHAGGFDLANDLSSLPSAEGFVIQGEFGSRLGTDVSLAGDVNGDGYDDIVICPQFGGRSYVIFGSGDGFDPLINLASLTPDVGVVIQGTGFQASSAGDVNGDGYDDLIVSGGTSGPVYVLFGGPDNFGVSGINTATLSATQGFVIQGTGQITSVASTGDLNGDGYDDVVIGTAFSGFGKAYVVFGGPDTIGNAPIDVTSLSAQEGFVVLGMGSRDYAGISVSTAGDVNGDGYTDLIIGGRGPVSGTDNGGHAYVIFGDADGFGNVAPGTLDLASLTSSEGFVIEGENSGNFAGISVSTAGDINGDGFDDLLVGAPLNSNGGTFVGAAYVIFGAATGPGAPIVASGDTLVGSWGDDILTGDGGADVLRGGAGDDTMIISDVDFADIDGGNGSDTLVLLGTGLDLDLSTHLSAKIDSIEHLDISGGGDNDLIRVFNVNSVTLDSSALLHLTEVRGTGVPAVRVDGDVNDVVKLVGGGAAWTTLGSTTVDGVLYDRYLSDPDGVGTGTPISDAELWIDHDLSVVFL